VFDGAGHEWDGVVESAGRAGVVVRLASPAAVVPEPAVAITLAVGWQKGEGLDAVVRDATSLGVAAVVPLATSHVAVPKRARGSSVSDRWRRIAVASAKQCGRAVVPALQPLATVGEVLADWRGERILMCVEPRRGGVDSAFDPGPRPSRALVLVGPEGGWSDGEVAQAVAAGARLVHLGPRTLRADLAPAVALSVLWAHWGAKGAG
jgi:16S rRNA (uracil1498-N3)-methyltransferase